MEWEIKIRSMRKTKTDVTINDYKGLLFSPILLPLHTICKSLMKLCIRFQKCNNVWKFPKNAFQWDNLP